MKVRILIARLICTLLIVLFAAFMAVGSVILLSGFGIGVGIAVAAILVIAGLVIILAIWNILR